MDVAKEGHELICHVRNVSSHNIGILHTFHLLPQNLTMEICIWSKRLFSMNSIHGVMSQNTAVWTFSY